jgi:DNA-binding transcriptional MerR regulator
MENSRWYRIGEIEEISGLNAQSIRRYDKRGILLGARDEQNNYRYYDSIELCMSIWVRYLQNYGMSLNEVEQFLSGDSDRQIAMTEDLSLRLQREEALIRLKSACLEDLTAALKQGIQAPDACSLVTRPAMLATFYRDHDLLIHGDETDNHISDWVNDTPIVRPMFRVSHDFLFDDSHPQTEYKIGLWIPQQYQELFNLSENTYCFSIPSQDCIHTIYEGYDSLASDDACLNQVRKRVLEFAADNGLSLADAPIYGSSFYSRRTEHGLHHMAHMWIPVQKNDVIS